MLNLRNIVAQTHARLSFTNKVCTTLGPTVDNMVGLGAFYGQLWYTYGYE